MIERARGERLGSIAQASADDVDRAVRAAAEAFPKWRKVSSRDRGQLLLRLAALIRENVEKLARDEARNVGKPIPDARGEVGLAANCFEDYPGPTNQIAGQTI